MLAELLNKTYDANINSLESLAMACGVDEIEFGGKIVSLELATIDGAKATQAIYEIREVMFVRRLAFRERRPDVDEETLKSGHAAKGYEFLFEGQAYVQNHPITVLAFAGPHGDVSEP